MDIIKVLVYSICCLCCLQLYNDAYSNVYFQGRFEYQLGSEPYDIKHTDVNNDGNVDLVISKKGRNGISVLIGKGDGYFEDQQIYSFFPAKITQVSFTEEMIPMSILIHDMNNDHINDIIVAIPYADSISVLKGSSINPYFQGPDQLITFRDDFDTFDGPDIYPCSLDVGDFDKNGFDDLVIALYKSNKIAVLYNDTGSIIKKNNRIELFTGDIGKLFNPVFVLSLDVNSDQHMDVAVANWGSACVSIFLNNKNGELIYHDSYKTGNYPQYITKGDFNKDDSIDLAVTNSQGNKISVLFGNNDGTFQSMIAYETGILPICIDTIDFNKDNYKDICVVNMFSNTISLMENNKNGLFTLFKTYSVAKDPSNICINDYNNDSFLDFAIISKETNNVSIILGKENGEFINGRLFKAGKETSYVTTYDIDNDKRQDIITANYEDDTISILKGIGGGGFDNQLIFNTKKKPNSLAMGDVNNDNNVDIAVLNSGSNSISILLGDGNDDFYNCKNYDVGEDPVAFTLCHLDNDQYLDVVTLNSTSNDLLIRFGQKQCLFSEPFSVMSSINNPTNFIMDDFDNDQLLDTIVLNLRTLNLSIFLNGKAFIEQPVNFLTGGDPSSIDSGDFNEDGYRDIVFSNKGSSSVSVLLGDGNGSFYTNQRNDYTVGASPISVKVADIDQDNHQDIIVANFDSKNITILFGNGDATFKESVFYGTGEKPSSIEISDIDNDNDLDIVVANKGDDNVMVLFNTKNNTMPFINDFYATQRKGAKNIFDFTCSSSSNLISSTTLYSIDFGDGYSDSNTDGLFYHQYNNTGLFSVVCTVENAGETVHVKPLLISIEEEDSNTSCFISILK